MSERRPLDGIRVLDLSHSMPGAVATMFLADYGAEVIRVEHPTGSVLRRTGGHSLWNRGKKSIVLDLDDAADAQVGRELAVGADVVIEDHRPGKAAGWRLDAAAVRSANPDVVFCSISAYGQNDSRRARNGADAAVVAHLGLMVEWGGEREGPMFLGHPAIDYSTALLASAGILACIRGRLVSGKGDTLDVSLLDGALALYNMNWFNPNAPGSVERKGKDGLRYGNKRLLLRMFECRDAKLVHIHTGAAGAFDRAMTLFGLDDRISKQQGDVQMASLLTDDELAVMERELPAIFATRTRDEWLDLLWANQIAALPVGEPGDALDDAQVRHAGLVVELDDPALGPIEVLGPVVKLSSSPGRIAAPAPELDRHGAEIRARGWSSEGLSTFDGVALDAPLRGLNIVEFATFFAAPYANRILSDLGADVVKVEAMEGDPMRPLTEYFEGANRGKKGLSANLKDPRAVEIVRELVAGANVVQHNLRPGAAERLGLDAATLRAVNDRLVYHYLPGYGSSGPKAMLQSFAPLQSAFVGTFALGAGLGNRPHQVFGNEDYYNGLLGATACLLGVIDAERTGAGQVVESPQLHSSMLVTSEYYKRGGSVVGAIPRMGAGLYGWSAGYRIYQCLDHWLVVTCTRDEQVVALARAVLSAEAFASFDSALLTADAPEECALTESLSYEFTGRLVVEWLDVLAEAGVPAEGVTDEPWMPRAMFHDAELVARASVREYVHPEAGPVRSVGDLIRRVGARSVGRAPSPTHGQHTREILQSLGRTHAEIDALIADRVVRA